MTDSGPTVAVLGPIPYGRIATHRADLLEKDGRVRHAVARELAARRPTSLAEIVEGSG